MKLPTWWDIRHAEVFERGSTSGFIAWCVGIGLIFCLATSLAITFGKNSPLDEYEKFQLTFVEGQGLEAKKIRSYKTCVVEKEANFKYESFLREDKDPFTSADDDYFKSWCWKKTLSDFGYSGFKK